MNRSFLSRIFWVILAWGLSACALLPAAATPAPTTELVVAIKSTEQSDMLTIIAEGQTISLRAEPSITGGTSFQWELFPEVGQLRASGSGLVATYEAPASIEKPLEVTIIVTATDSNTQQTANGSFIISLLPAPTPTPTLLPTETPIPTKVVASATPEMTSPLTLDIPQAEADVACSVNAKGRYAPALGAAYIWPMVCVLGNCHPQDSAGKAAKKNNGHWSSMVFFGDCVHTSEADQGKPFRLLVGVADPTANQFFEDYLANAALTGVYPGIPEGKLPEGFAVYQDIVVTRK